MGAPSVSSLFLPPGCRFFPSPEELLSYYLTRKNSSHSDHSSLYGFDLIRDLNLYDYEPFDLPETTCYRYGCGGRKRHWYCYTVRTANESERGSRRAKGGYWRRKGRTREVTGVAGKAVLGTRNSFVFYVGNSTKSAVRTDWFMYEYALLQDFKASFVLCRVFVKSRSGNSISDNVISSCAEESVSAVRHIGIQHDGSLICDTVEAESQDVNCINWKNNGPGYPFRQIIELDDRLRTEAVSAASFRYPSGILHRELVTSQLSTDQLQSILGEDFIELNDIQQ